MKQNVYTILLLIAFIAVCVIITAVLPVWFYRCVVLILLFSILSLMGAFLKRNTQ